VRAGDGIEEAVDEAKRDLRPAHRREPAIAQAGALVEVTDEEVEDAATVVLDEEGPELVEEHRARRGAGAEDAAHPGVEGALAAEAANERAERAVEEALDGARAVGLGEEASVEEADRAEDEARSSALFVSGEELLRDAVAVVVREDVRARGALRGEQALDHRGLIDERVRVAPGLRRVAEAEEVGGDDAEAGGERGPERGEVPRGAGEAVEDHEGRALALGVKRDGVAAVEVALGARAPGVEGRRGRGGHCFSVAQRARPSEARGCASLRAPEGAAAWRESEHERGFEHR
jgi:hypothetical protein